MNKHILSVSEAQAKLQGGRCPFCGNKPKVEKRIRSIGYVWFRGFCEHLRKKMGFGEPTAILAQPSTWQGPGWPYRGGLLVSASGANSYGTPAREEKP